MQSTGRLIPHYRTEGIDWTFLVLRGKSLKLVGMFIFNPLAFYLQKSFFMICCCCGYHLFCLLTRPCCVLLQIHKYRLNTGFSVCILLKNSVAHIGSNATQSPHSEHPYHFALSLSVPVWYWSDMTHSLQFKYCESFWFGHSCATNIHSCVCYSFILLL